MPTLPPLTVPNIVAGVILLALTAYVLLGGADFGGGVWDLLSLGPRREEQRRLIQDAIAPVWEANHVWLILAIVLLFTCFSPVFAAVAIVLHIPLTLMLLGIVLRGSTFMFRSYGGGGAAARTFAIASLLTPVLLGVSVGAVAAGRIPAGLHGDSFSASFVRPWFTPFSFAVGMFTLSCFAFLAAVYLTLETTDVPLQEDFRRRSLGAGGAVVLMAVIGLAVFREAPNVPWLMVALTAAAALAAFWTLWQRRYLLARLAAAGTVTLILWGWAVAQYPYLLPPDLTIAQAAAPRITLELVLIALLVGAAVLFPSLYYLFTIFKKRNPSAAPPTTPRARLQ